MLLSMMSLSTTPLPGSQVMMVQARLRSSRESSTSSTALSPRTPSRRRLPEPPSPERSESSWSPSESAESLPVRVSGDATAAKVVDGAPIAEAVDQSSVAKGNSFDGLGGVNQEGDIARETMTYEGSVRSGQQVGARPFIMWCPLRIFASWEKMGG